MNGIEMIFHAVMIICTCGIWYPVYRGRKRSIGNTTIHYDR